MDLTELSDKRFPEFSVTLGGREFHFSAFLIDELIELQAWLNPRYPHPLDAIKPHLAGFPPEIVSEIVERTRKESFGWTPPEVGSPAGAQALLGTFAGQIQVLWMGLKIHHPETTRNYAGRVYDAVKREVAKEAAEARKQGKEYTQATLISRIYGTLFNNYTEDDDGPKAVAAQEAASNGNSFSAQPSSVLG